MLPRIGVQRADQVATDTAAPVRRIDHEPPHPPTVIEGSDEYEIEKIIDHEDRHNGRRYLVHWLGYPNSDDEWIHEGNIAAKELIGEYLEGGVQGHEHTVSHKNGPSHRLTSSCDITSQLLSYFYEVL